MFDALRRIYSLEPTARHAEAVADAAAADIPTGDPRRKQAREEALRELENFYLGMRGLQEREAQREELRAAASKERQEQKIRDRHAAFAAFDERNHLELLRFWRDVLRGRVDQRLAGSAAPGLPPDPPSPVAPFEWYSTGLRGCVTLIAAPGDMASLTKAYRLPDTLAWLANGLEHRAYALNPASLAFSCFLGKRLRAIVRQDLPDNDELRRFVVAPVRWLVPPKDALPKGELDLPTVPERLLSIISASGGDPGGAAHLEKLIFN